MVSVAHLNLAGPVQPGHTMSVLQQEEGAVDPKAQGACLSLDAPTVLSQDNAGASSPVLISSKQQVQIISFSLA